MTTSKLQVLRFSLFCSCHFSSSIAIFCFVFYDRMQTCSGFNIVTHSLKTSVVRHPEHMTVKQADVKSEMNVVKCFASFQVDHFGYANEDKFNLRYLINDAYYGGHKAPVFFYAGNEGDIEWFCNNTVRKPSSLL